MKKRYWMGVFLYCAGIFLLSSRPVPDIPTPSIPGLDKIAHAVIFGGLVVLISVGLRRSNPGLRPMIQIFVPIGFVAVYGLSDEIHQFFVIERSFDLLDWVADITGACLAQWLLCGYWWRIRLRPASTTE